MVRRSRHREQIEPKLVGARDSLSGGRQLISCKGLHAHAHALRALSVRVLTPRLDCAYPEMVTGSSFSYTLVWRSTDLELSVVLSIMIDLCVTGAGVMRTELD